MATAQSAEGIILRKYYLRETSYILVVFTKEFGKIKGVLKGIRNPYPQFAGNFEIFTLCQLLFYRKKKKGMDLITQCEAMDLFYPVRKDIERLTYASYFIELVETITSDHDVNEGLYEVLLESLKLLATDSSPRRVGRIFELKLLDSLGLRPMLEGCAVCGRAAEDKVRFSAANGGLLCGGCAGSDETAFPVSRGAVNFMRKILVSPIYRTAQIKVSREVGKEIERILKRFVGYHVARPVRSMRFLEQLQKQRLIN